MKVSRGVIDDEFIAYRGPHDLHDGTVVSVNSMGDSTLVVVELCEGGVAEIDFKDPEQVRATDAVGMMLHALAELRGEGSCRRFTFVNWDESSNRALEIWAHQGRWRTQQDNAWHDL